MMLIRTTTILTATLLVLSGCGKSSGGGNSTAAAPPPSNAPTTSAPPSPSPTPSALSFATVNAQIFQPHCAQCHSAAAGNRGGVNLETYMSAVRVIDRVRNEVIVEETMPPTGPLPLELRNLLQAWINAGAPQ